LRFAAAVVAAGELVAVAAADRLRLMLPAVLRRLHLDLRPFRN